MSVKNLFLFDAIVLLIFGIPMIINPQILASLIFTDATLTDSVIVTFRSYGMILSSAAVAVFYGRNATHSPIRTGLVIFIAIPATFIAIYTIYAIDKGFENNMVGE